MQSGAWSPDGRQIVYLDSSGVHVVNIDGGGNKAIPVRLTGTEIQMVWSPDSTRLAFASGFEDPHLKDPDVARGIAPDGRRIMFSGTVG